MNKLYLVIVALFTSIHSISWSMLTVRTIQNIHSSEKLFTKEKIQEKAQSFLDSFGQKSIDCTSKSFCVLPLGSKQKVVSRLSYDQLVFLWFGAQGLDIPLLTVLCNSNENVAHIYRNEPINRILQDLARAKEWQKFGKMDMQHFMVLKNSQIRLSQDVFLQSTILPSNASQFMKALEILKKIEPELDIAIITDSTKCYPLLKEQVMLFWNTPVPINAMVRSFLTGVGTGMTTFYSNSDTSFFKALIISSIGALPVPIMCGLWEKYKDFCINLKNSLPNQPTLTDVLKKQSS